MSQVPNIGLNTRPHFAGAQANTDIHLELYDGRVEHLFNYNATFMQFSPQVTVTNNTNTYRLDKLGSSQVLGRRSMGDINAQRIASEKETIVVSTMMYIRNIVDSIDDTLAPSFWELYGNDNGTRFAEAFDQAHIIKLQKAPAYVAPDSIRSSIGDGFYVTANVKANASTTADLEANAVAIWNAQKAVVDHLRKRNVPLDNMVTIMNVDNFSTLTNHPKALNKDYSIGGGDFASRRLLQMNGIPALELTTFPTGAVVDHILTDNNAKADFELSADEAKGTLIVFDRVKSLKTIFAKQWASDFYEDKTNMQWVLDNKAIFTVAVNRADTVGVVRVVEA